MRLRTQHESHVEVVATIYHFDIDVADHDRNVFESLALKVARHPSESEDYMWTRVLAYALEYTEGIEFSRGGISEPEDPPIAIRDLTGAYRSWIEIGTPDADRLHKASKASPRVAVYLHKDPQPWLNRLDGSRIHRAGAIEIHAMDRALLDRLAAHLERRIAFSLSVSDRELHLSLQSASVSGRMTRLTLS